MVVWLATGQAYGLVARTSEFFWKTSKPGWEMLMCRWVALPVLRIFFAPVVTGMLIAGSVIETSSPEKRLIPSE